MTSFKFTYCKLYILTTELKIYMVERSIFIEASNSRWCASPRYRTSHLVVSIWCGWRDLNPHELAHMGLSHARLPFRHARRYLVINNIFLGWITDFNAHENIIIASHISDKIKFYSISIKSLNVIFILFNNF